MPTMFNIFAGDNAAMMASVVAFVASSSWGVWRDARQGIALAFAFTPLLLFFVIELAAATVR